MKIIDEYLNIDSKNMRFFDDARKISILFYISNTETKMKRTILYTRIEK